MPGNEDGLVAAGRRLAETAAPHALKSETARRLTPEVADAIVEAGFPRHFVPARWGGTEGTFVDCVRAAAHTAEGDPSAAWVASVVASLGRMATYLPEAGQRALWQRTPDTFIACGLVASGTATEEGDGWRVRGVWQYVSGIHFSDWALVACPVPAGDDGHEVRFLLLPRSAYTVEDSWFTVGMRATGSDSLRIDDAFVPKEYSFPRGALLAGTPPEGAPRTSAVPLRAVSGLTFAGPVLGAARGALRAFGADLARRRASGPGHRVLAGNDAAAQTALARGLARTEAAGLLLEEAATAADRGAAPGPGTARLALHHAVVAELLADTVQDVLRLSGTSSHDQQAPLQRFWRDATTAASHAVLRLEPAGREYVDALVAQDAFGGGTIEEGEAGR
ncbi:acyl-CoA dehydrogenase family protein [Streptomyces tricolor]|uniref:acyl-CoA dehydrogenase family protein n=1 Tax=Streptomyces tricolor TaxID=68277 RepID=UPI0036E0F74E